MQLVNACLLPVTICWMNLNYIKDELVSSNEGLDRNAEGERLIKFKHVRWVARAMLGGERGERGEKRRARGRERREEGEAKRKGRRNGGGEEREEKKVEGRGEGKLIIREEGREYSTQGE